MYNGWTESEQATKARAARIAQASKPAAPLVIFPIYFERDYCPDCMIAHMIEKTRAGQIICHGENFYFSAQKARTHYSRRLGKGFELVPITTPNELPFELFANMIEEPEYIDIDQDW